MLKAGLFGFDLISSWRNHRVADVAAGVRRNGAGGTYSPNAWV
jgi:hypothetical protein